MRELILDSMLWLLHRTSSFDLSLEAGIVKDACQSVGGLYGCTKHMSPLAISVVWLLCLSHADMTDGCKNHLLLSNIQDSTRIGPCDLIHRGIIRCMSGITESISLPSLLLWLPHMLNSSSSNQPDQSVIDLSHFSVRLHICGATFGKSFTSLIFALMGSAINFISSLATGSEGSNQARETMKTSLRNLTITPLLMIQQLCLGIQDFSHSLEHDRTRNSSSGSKVSDIAVYGKVFTVWMDLEKSQRSNISDIFRPSPLNGYYRNNIPLDEIDELFTYLTRSLSFLQEAIRHLLSDSSGSTYYLLSTTSFNLCVLWWCCVNCLALTLLDDSAEIRTLSILRSMLSSTIVNPMMTLFLFLKDVSLSISCHLTRSIDCLPPNSSTMDSSHLDSADQATLSLVTVTHGDIFSTWLTFVLDVVLKLIFISERVRTPENLVTPLVSDFVYSVLTHLSSLNIEKMLTVDTFLSSKEERSSRVAKFCQVLSTLSLVPSLLHSKDHVIDGAVEQFVVEWNGKRKLAEHRCRDIAPKKEKFKLLGEEIFPFSDLQREIFSESNSNFNETDEHTAKNAPLETPVKPPPSDHRRLRASHPLTCSPYSPVISLRRGHESCGSQTKILSSDQISTLKATPPQHKMFDEPIDLCTTIAPKKRVFQDTSDYSVDRLADQTYADSSPPLSPSPKRTRSEPEIISSSPEPSPAPSMNFDSSPEKSKPLYDSSQKCESEVIQVNQSVLLNYSAEKIDSGKGYPPSQGITLVSQCENPSHLVYARTLTSGCGRTELYEKDLETQTLSGRTLRFDQGITDSSITPHNGNDHQIQVQNDRQKTLETISTYLDHAQDALNLASQNLPTKSDSRRCLLESTEIQSTSETAEQLWSSQLDITLFKCHELMGHLLSLRRTFPSSSSSLSSSPSVSIPPPVHPQPPH